MIIYNIVSAFILLALLNRNVDFVTMLIGAEINSQV